MPDVNTTPPNKDPKIIVQLACVVALVLIVFIDSQSVSIVNKEVYWTLAIAIVGAEVYNNVRRP